MSNAEDTAERLVHRRAKRLGVRIAIDDFGTGYPPAYTWSAFPSTC